MSNINTNGRTTVTSEVRGADELTVTIDKAIQYVVETGKDFNGKSSLIVNAIKRNIDIDEFGVFEFNELVTFISRVTDYDNYTVIEYAYMYTAILDKINNN